MDGVRDFHVDFRKFCFQFEKRHEGYWGQTPRRI